MPSTSKGWPYPDGSTKIGELHLAVKALADMLNARILIGQADVTINAGATFGNISVPTAPLTGAKLKVFGIPETTGGYTTSLPAAPVAGANTQLRAHRPAGASTGSAATFPLHYIAVATD